MNIVSTLHGHDSGGRGEHILPTYRTITISGAFDAAMVMSVLNVDAYIAPQAMNVVFANAFASSTNAAVWAVVDVLCWIVVPQLTYITVITCCLLLALSTELCSLLRMTTKHAKNITNVLPDKLMILCFVVTVTARVESLTLRTLHFDITHVVLTSERRIVAVAVVIDVVCIELFPVVRIIRWGQLMLIERSEMSVC